MRKGPQSVALTELKEWVHQRFEARIRALTLFGSRARGEATEDSDVDVLVMVDNLTAAEAREVAHFCGDLLTRHDVLVSPFAVSTEYFSQLRQRERRIALEIEKDGVPV
ncbi:MAG: nucleotidyltransferase family protein [Myxococcaceae bacterium]